MQATVKDSHLRDALTIVRRTTVAPSKKRNPVLAHVRISARDDSIELVTTTLETVSRVVVAANVSEPGSVCVPANELSQCVRKSSIVRGKRPPRTLHLSSDADSHTLRVDTSSSSSSYKIAGISTTQFPILPLGTPVELETFRVRDIVAALRMTLPAVSRDETRYNLNGIHAREENNGVVFVATDGHRLGHAFIEGHVLEPGKKEGVTLPLAFWSVVSKLIDRRKPVGETVTFSASDPADGARRLYCAGVGSVSIYARELDGDTFPDYNQVIPCNGHRVVLDRVELCEAMERLDAFARVEKGRAAIAHFKVGRGTGLLIEAEQNGEISSTTVEAAVSDGAIGAEFRINTRYVCDAIAGWDTATVEAMLPDPDEEGRCLSPIAFCHPRLPLQSIVMPARL